MPVPRIRQLRWLVGVPLVIAGAGWFAMASFVCACEPELPADTVRARETRWEMEQALRELVAAQDAYRSAQGRFAGRVEDLPLGPGGLPPGLAVTVLESSAEGYRMRLQPVPATGAYCEMWRDGGDSRTECAGARAGPRRRAR